MSTRRSRIQVKPNLGSKGPKTTGNRSGKPEDKTSQSATPSYKSLSSPRNTNTAQETFEIKSSINKAENVLVGSTGKETLPTDVRTRNRKHLDSQGENTRDKEVSLLTSSVQSEKEQTLNNQADKTSETTSGQETIAVEFELTKIKEKPGLTDGKLPKENECPELVTGLHTVPVASPEKSERQTLKPTPRLRSRFLNRVKPNITDAGKSRTRRSVSKTGGSSESSAPTDSPVKTPVKTTDRSGDFADGEISTDGQSGDTILVSDTTVLRTESEGKLSQLHCGSAEACEDGLGAEVVIAEEEEKSPDGNDKEVFTPPMPVSRPQRVVSPVPVADSDVSKDVEEVSEEPTPPPTPKQKRRVPKVTAPVDKPPDKFKMLMKDLIYWNPVTNPMKVREKQKLGNSGEITSEKTNNTPPDVVEEDEELPVPQVKIGPDGSIILNEESLVIDKRGDQSEMDDGVVEESESLITYSSFRTRHLSKNWTEKETERFYYALSIVGTDFSMMSNLFKRRNRYDLKKKFKREEKYNRSQVDEALRNRKKIDMSVFENVSDEDEDSIKKKKKKTAKNGMGRGQRRGRGRSKGHGEDKAEEIDKPKGKTKKNAKSGKKRKTVYYEEDSEESEREEQDEAVDKNRDSAIHQSPRVPLELEDDEDENEDYRTVARKDPEGSSDEEEARVLQNMCQTTRSGRVPKRTNFYTEQEQRIAPKRLRKETSVGVQAGLPGGDVESSAGEASEANRTSTEAVQIQTVHNIPNVGGGQLVLVTQKGEDGQGQQGTVIHVYMLSPSSHRSPDWPASPLTSPRTNPHVYSVSPRGSHAEGTGIPVLPINPQVVPCNSPMAVVSTDDVLPVVCAEETVATSETEPTLEQAVLEALRE